MSPDEPADVIGNLPRTRPARRSPHRGARVSPATADGAATGEAATPAEPAATPAPKAATPATPKPKPAAKAAPKRAAAKPKAGAKPAAKAKAAPKAAAPGKVRGVTKTAPGRKVAARDEADAKAKAEAGAAPASAKPPIPPAGYAVPGSAQGGGGLNVAEAVRTAGQLAELGIGALRGLLGR